ncbi:MAG: hypothetical protein O7G85_08030 [Planctomycetota bacterium]|nr:hypothetical protein [Planctomycetota bacterium]
MICYLRTTALLLTATSLLFLSACVDENAKLRAEVQVDIQDASLKFREATLGAPAPGTPEYDSAYQNVQSVINDLNGIRGGEAGQQAAKSMLLANANAHLADLDLARILQIENSNDGLCGEMSTIATRCADLQYRIAALENLDLTHTRDTLDHSKSMVNMQLDTLIEQKLELQGPIDDRLKRNADDAAEVTALRKQYNDLMRQARESGYAEGFDSHVRAVQIQRQADMIEFEIAQRDIELDLNLQAEQNFLTLNEDNAINAVASIENAEDALESYTQISADDNDQSRQTIDELNAILMDKIEVLRASIRDDLTPLYESANQSLLQAVNAAQVAAGKAGRGEGEGAANTLAARIYQTLGQLHWSKAQRYSTLRSTCVLIVESGEAPDGMYDMIEQFETAQSEAMTQAKEAYSQAQQKIEQVSGNSRELTAYKQNIQLMMASLEGEDISETFQPTRETGSGAEESAPTQEATSDAIGFPTSDDLMTHLQGAASSGNILSVFDVMYTRTSQGASNLQAAESFFDALDEMQGLISQTFGDNGAPIAQSLNMIPQMALAQISQLGASTEESRSDDRITYQITGPAGQTEPLSFIRVDGLWYVDGDEDSSTADELAQMETATQAFSQLSAQISDGSVADVQQLQTAMQQVFASMQ